MNAKFTPLISLILVLSLAGMVQAQNIEARWNDATEDHLWSNPDNWGAFPTPSHWAKIRNGLPGPTIDFEGALAQRVHVGYSEGGALTVDGGTLVINGDDLLLGKNGGSGILNMISGSIDIARDFEVGGGEPGTVNMTGGTITVGDDLMIPEATGTEAIVNLNGGTISLSGDLTMDEGGILDITAGTLILDGNALSTVQGYIDNGWISAYDGNGTIHMDYDVNEVHTTVKAVHKLAPYPIDGGWVIPGQVALNWTLPDPCTPGQPVPVDVYFTDDYQALKSFLDPASMRIVSQGNATSFSVQAVPKTRYYWAVDTYQGTDNDPVWGPIFTFLSDNVAPEVLVGDDVTTWLDSGIADVALDGTVTDLDPTTVMWTIDSEPNEGVAVIADPTQLQTAVSFSAAGTYVLQLEADDGEKQGSDSLTINVYSDQCEAAKSDPDWQALPGDINLDCVVDQTDLDILLEQWLNCNGSDCPEIDPVNPSLL